MSGLTWFYVIFTYVATAVFLVGFLSRIWKYAKTPAPLKITLTPAPASATGVVSRMVQETTLFKSLFKSNRIIWLGGYVFHLMLAVVLIKHLRFFFASTPAIVNYITTFEMYAGVVMLGALGFLMLLRLVVDRTLFISVMTDYLLLALLMAIAATGVLLKYFARTDIENIKEFMLSLISLNPVNMPVRGMFLVHFTLVLLFIMYFPFSKLMHAGGVFFSPTRNQADNPRNTRHVNPWAANEQASGGGTVEAGEESPEPAA